MAATPSIPPGDFARIGKAAVIRGRLRCLAALALMLAPVFGGGGCTRFVTNMMATAPNHYSLLVGDYAFQPSIDSMFGVDAEFKVKVGPPDATLAVSVINPTAAVAPAGPRGTVVVLHGLGARAAWMQHTARRLTEGGYRAVLVDLRGHGRSSGEWLAYGTTESRDLVQVTNELSQRGLIAGRLGVYGVSYGAATAIQWAAIDPRVEAVVAVAPFSTLRDVAPSVASAILPGMSHLVSMEDIDSAVSETSRLAETDLDQHHPLAAISHIRAPVLLIHGIDDRLIPASHSQRLRNASPHNTRLLLLPYMGHNAVWYDSEGKVARHARGWFEDWLK